VEGLLHLEGVEGINFVGDLVGIPVFTATPTKAPTKLIPSKCRNPSSYLYAESRHKRGFLVRVHVHHLEFSQKFSQKSLLLYHCEPHIDLPLTLHLHCSPHVIHVLVTSHLHFVLFHQSYCVFLGTSNNTPTQFFMLILLRFRQHTHTLL